MGMTYELYWKSDCELVRAYRKAYEYKQEYDNTQLWLQGLYVYRAMESQRPGWAFMSKHPRPEKYLEKPIAITKGMQERQKIEQTAKLAEQFRAAFAQRNRKLEETDDGGRKTDNQGTT